MSTAEWSATLSGEPASKARPRLGKGRVYTPAATAEAEDAWRWELRKMIALPIDDQAFAVRLRFHSGSWKRKDIDNMIKLVLDACNEVVWDDDRQVVGIDAWLYRGSDDPRTELTLQVVDQPLAPTIDCLTCGKTVPARMNRQRDGTDQLRRYCSSECSWADKRTERVCERCGLTFVVPLSHKARHCSRECAGTAGGTPSSITPEQLRRAVMLVARGRTQAKAAEEVGVDQAALSRAIMAASRSKPPLPRGSTS